MKVLYCTSEARPFAATGGLADVAGSLPQALRARLIGCRVVMPLYEEIPQNLRDTMKFITSLSVPVAWRRQYCGVFEARSGGVIYYLIDNQYYFKRKGLYGHYDDAERFAFLSRAALEMLPYIDFRPDVIHCNDWQTALVPVYYSIFYANNEWYRGIKTVFTIHNIQYQGKYGKELLEDVLGIPGVGAAASGIRRLREHDEGRHRDGQSRVTTVSPTYAQEILDPWFCPQDGHHPAGALLEAQRHSQRHRHGSYNPETDKDIYANYSVQDMSGKAVNKLELQKRLNLAETPDVPLIGMVTRMVAHKGLDLVKETLDQLMWESNIQFVILGSGDYEYETFFREMQNKYPGRLCACFGFVPELSRKIYAGADIFLMPSKSEPCGLSQMIALRYGTIPVVRATGGLKDSIQDSGDGEGNGFTFQSYNGGDMLYAIHRALEGYAQADGWKILVDRAMKSDNSWGRSANDYIRMYRDMLKE